MTFAAMFDAITPTPQLRIAHSKTSDPWKAAAQHD
jgi:hypothetical protein